MPWHRWHRAPPCSSLRCHSRKFTQELRKKSQKWGGAPKWATPPHDRSAKAGYTLAFRLLVCRRLLLALLALLILLILLILLLLFLLLSSHLTALLSAAVQALRI